MTSLDQIFNQWALTTPTQDALLGLGRPPLTFAHLRQQLQTLRQILRRQGLGRTARLALLAPNGPELALAFLASATSTICAPLNPAYRQEELAFYLDDLDASALLIASTLDSPARDLAHVRGIPILELHAQPDQPAGCFTLEGTSGLPAVSESPVTPDDVALILHTSGTTARPKQVPLTQANLCASIRHLQQGLTLTPQDRCLNFMPLFHIHGLVGALLAALGSGGSVVCPPSFVASEIFAWLQTYQATWYTAVPTLHQAILAQARLSPTTLHNGPLRFIRSSSASLPPTVMAELEQVFGVPVIEAYGMTEAAHQMTSNPLPPRMRKPGSVGLPAGPKIAILSKAGMAQTPGQLGEVVINGPNVMSGYCENPQANAEAFQDDWFRTGDQGYLDDDGYLFLTGRIKEQINRGGEKIAPLEIDRVLLQHSSIQQAVTFAMPHPTLGEEVAAAVVLHEGATVKEEELRQWLSLRLAQYKVPRKILFLDDIPKGPTGKIQRRALTDYLTDMLKAPSTIASDPIQNFLIDVFQNVLKIDQLGIDDNFFVVGGDSLQATQIANRVQQSFALTMDAVTIFEHPTVRALSQQLATQMTSKNTPRYLESLSQD